jgi:DNA-binding NarL/FixJ family response regulator
VQDAPAARQHGPAPVGVLGVTATAQITRAELTKAPRVVALTTFDADELVRQAITAGAVGYLVKDRRWPGPRPTAPPTPR